MSVALPNHFYFQSTAYFRLLFETDIHHQEKKVWQRLKTIKDDEINSNCVKSRSRIRQLKLGEILLSVHRFRSIELFCVGSVR